jgi:hypothetical protein
VNDQITIYEEANLVIGEKFEIDDNFRQESVSLFLVQEAIKATVGENVRVLLLFFIVF